MTKIQDILNYQEAEKLLNQINKRYTRGKRNYALFSVILNTGLRVSEASNLKTKYINLDEAVLTVKQGKGKKDRKIPFPSDIVPCIKEWIAEKDRLDIKSEYLFCSYRKFNNKTGQPGRKLTPRYIEQVLKSYIKKAGIDKDIHVHCLRHTYATAMYQQTKDLEALRKLLGHSKIQTTLIYMNHYSTADLQDNIKNFKPFLVRS